MSDVKMSGVRGCKVVLDTNILQQTSLLRDARSTSLLRYLALSDSRLGLPEVACEEWMSHWVEHVRERYGEYEKSGRWLSEEFSGVLFEEFDAERFARERFGERLKELERFILRYNHSPEEFVDAGRMVIRKEPPSTSKSQQFKDSLLWRAVLGLASQGPCILVTADKGFRGASHGELAENLREEVERLEVDVTLINDLNELLKLFESALGTFEGAITSLVKRDRISIKRAFANALKGGLNDFEVASLKGWKFATYPSDMPDQVTVTVEVEVEFSEGGHGLSYPIQTTVTGGVLYHVRTGVLEVVIDEVHLWQTEPYDLFDEPGLGTWPRPVGRSSPSAVQSEFY